MSRAEAVIAEESRIHRLIPMAEVTKNLKRHLDNILTYLEPRITNAVAEGLNSKIQHIKSATLGFRKFENFRIAMYSSAGNWICIHRNPSSTLVLSTTRV